MPSEAWNVNAVDLFSVYCGAKPVCRMDKYSGSEGVANARLIAAAPDLLAACEAVVEWASRHDVRASGGPIEAVEAARTAIAKAKGGTA